MNEQYHNIFIKYINNEINKLTNMLYNKNYNDIEEEQKVKLQNEYNEFGKLYFIELENNNIEEDINLCKDCMLFYKNSNININNTHYTHNITYIGLSNKIKSIFIKHIPKIKPISKQTAYLLLQDIKAIIPNINNYQINNYKINNINKLINETVYSLHYKDPIMTDLFIEMICKLYMSIINQL